MSGERLQAGDRCVLFLQGPLSSFYSEIASGVTKLGARMLRVNFCGNDVLDWHHPAAINFRGRPEQWEPFLKRLIETERVTDVILHGDRRFYHLVARHVCAEKGVTVVATELGYLRPDWMTVERGACSVQSHFPSDPERIRQIAAGCAQPDPAVMFPGDAWRTITQELRFTAFNTLLWPLFPHYRNHRQESRFEVYTGWLRARLTGRLREKRSAGAVDRLLSGKAAYHLVALQLDGDFQIRDHSPFANMGEAIRYIACSFAGHADPESLLVLKTHPLEYRYGRVDRAIAAAMKEFDLGGRIVRIDGGDLKALAASASGFVTVNSSAGLDALASGCPTMSIMPTIYDVEGLTFQGPLDAFWQNATRPDASLFNDLRRALSGTIQVRGTIYNPEGLKAAAEAIARKIVTGSVNPDGSFVSPPPRLEKAARMGITY